MLNRTRQKSTLNSGSADLGDLQPCQRVARTRSGSQQNYLADFPEARASGKENFFMRPKALSAVVIVFVLLTALSCFAQQTDIRQFAAFGAYSYLATPSLNLDQRGFDGDFGYNYNSWLTLGFDFSTFTGHSSLVPGDLNAATQAKLAPFLPYLPPGFVLAVPYNSSTQTYEGGPQFNYRHFQHVTLFARPALGALHASFSSTSNNPDIQLIVKSLLNGGLSKSDTVVFYGVGGGATWEITPHFGIRATVDYARYNFFSDLLNGPRNSVRLSIGTKFGFGKNIVK